MASQTVFWIDSVSNKLLAGWNIFAQAAKPVFRQGDTLDVLVRWVKKPSASYSSMEEVPWGTGTLSILVGNRSARPMAGKWYLSYGDSTSELLDYNAAAEDVEIALNSMPDIVTAGGVSVTQVNEDGYKIVFEENGARDQFVTNGEALVPTCTVYSTQTAAGSSSTKAVYWLQIRQNAVSAIEGVWTQEAACEAAVAEIAGHIKELYMTSNPKSGEFSFDLDGDAKVASVHISTSAMEQLLGAGYTVTKTGDFRWRIESDDRTAFVIDNLDSSAIESFNGLSGTLKILDAQAAEILCGASEIPTTVEFVLTDGSDRRTLAQVPCLLVGKITE